MIRILFKEKFFVRILVLVAAFTAVYLYNDRITTNYQRSHDTQMRMAVIRTLGVPAIPIISQCCTSRNLSEGVYVRRSDIPGGFCFHSDCDIIAVPKNICEKNYAVKVIKR